MAEDRGVGNIVNVPIEPATPREKIMELFRDGLARVGREFDPEFVLISCGFDAYEYDQIGGLGLRPEDYRTMTDAVMALKRPVVSALEGGYNLDGIGGCAEHHVEGLLAEED